MTSEKSLKIDKTAVWLFCVAIIFIVAALLKLTPLLRNYDTVHVRFEFDRETGFAGARLDEVLLSQLTPLSYTRAFDKVLSQGVRKMQMKASIWMDRCEVRQGAFSKFSQWSAFYPDLPISAPHQPPDWRYFSESQNHTISGRLDASANGVTWFDAYAYCKAAGGRLPTADEWVAAASGKAQRLYPWGDNFTPEGWPYLDPRLNAAQQCGIHAETDTPEGISDLGSNVSEWASPSQQSKAAFIMGGNAYNIPRELYSLSMLYRPAPLEFRSPYLGFRCVYDAPPASSTTWRAQLKAFEIPPGEYSVGMPENSRVPGIVTVLPKDRPDLIKRIFGSTDEQQVPVDLYVTATEITRRQYAVFLRDPFVKAGLYAEENQPKDHSYIPPDWDEQIIQSDLPVVNVEWWSAYAFAAWAGGRLLTEEEWASISSGQGRRLYPWGDVFDGSAAAIAEQRLGGPVPVASLKKDKTPEGVFDLGGNVSEWTRSVSSASGIYGLVVKGGNYLLPGEKAARMDFNNSVSPHYRSPTIGFRIVFENSR